MSERVRRSHAERTAETRARIVAAVVESIAEVGFQRTTASEIVRRAGVTWGAVQHHFGDKNGILAAVLEDSFGRFAARLSAIDLDPAAPLDKRVALFVEGAWDHFGSPHFRSVFEILLNLPVPAEGDPEHAWQWGMLDAWNRIWERFFPDAGLSPRRRYALQHYTISVLAGLASVKMLEGPEARVRSLELELLEDTLIRTLSGVG